MCYKRVRTPDLSCVDVSVEADEEPLAFLGQTHASRHNPVSQRFCYFEERQPRGDQKVFAFPTKDRGKHRVELQGRGARWLFVHADSCYAPDIGCTRCILDEKHPTCFIDSTMMDESWLVVEVFNADPDDELRVRYIEAPFESWLRATASLPRYFHASFCRSIRPAAPTLLPE